MTNRHRGKRPLGAVFDDIKTQLGWEDSPIDASSATAQLLGFVNGMQYKGLEREYELLNTTNVELTNCFAATFGIIEDVEQIMYDVRSFSCSWNLGFNVSNTHRYLSVIFVEFL